MTLNTVSLLGAHWEVACRWVLVSIRLSGALMCDRPLVMPVPVSVMFVACLAGPGSCWWVLVLCAGPAWLVVCRPPIGLCR